MNAHLERFNRTIQEEFINYHSFLLLSPNEFNRKLMDYLIFYNTQRVHYAFKNKLSPIQFMLSLQQSQRPMLSKMLQKSRIGCGFTGAFQICIKLSTDDNKSRFAEGLKVSRFKSLKALFAKNLNSALQEV